jgi:Mor family transcriptional regulator
MISDLEAQVRAVLAGLGIPADVAAIAGKSVGELLVSEWGGIEVYIPKRANDEIAKKHEQVRIMAETTGATRTEVCRTFQISKRQYHRILKKVP